MTKLGTPLKIVVWLGIAILVMSPERLLACPICFGASDAPAARGMTLAIFTLLGVTGSVLGSFLAFFVYLFRRANAMRDGHERHEDIVDSRA